MTTLDEGRFRFGFSTRVTGLLVSSYVDGSGFDPAVLLACEAVVHMINDK